jgi:hypothetical protein
MAVPEDNINQARGMLNGHAVAIAMAAIFVGTGLVVAFVASDGTIFGFNFRPTAGSGTPASDNNVDSGNMNAVSRDLFDEGSSAGTTAKAAQSPASATSSGAPPEHSSTLTDEQNQLLGISNFHWDSIAGKYVASNEYTVDKIQQTIKQKPVQTGTEPLALSDKIAVNLDLNGDTENHHGISRTSIPDIQQTDTPVIVDDNESTADNSGQSPVNSNETTSENDQPSQPDIIDDSGNSTSNTTSTNTDTNNTSSGSTSISIDRNSTEIDLTIR